LTINLTPINLIIAAEQFLASFLVEVTVRVKGKQQTITKRTTEKTNQAQEPNKYIETLFMVFLILCILKST